MTFPLPYDEHALPDGVCSRFIQDVNGLTLHILEAGDVDPNRPAVLLLHGFPELAYSWRKVMPALAEAGYHVIAPDQRGYGRTMGWSDEYDTDLGPYRLLNLVRDMLSLIKAVGSDHVNAVVGHDFGASVAAYAALIRPDVFRAMTLMSAPFAGPPALGPVPPNSIHTDMIALDRPRKHYQWYYSSRLANSDMHFCPQGVHDFLRAYFHQKSADWEDNKPFPLTEWTAAELAKMPNYYIMDLDKDMAETVAEEMPSAEHIAANSWLPERELLIYSTEYKRTGFQGALNWYRCRTNGIQNKELDVFAGRTIDVPSCFIAGASDWGIHQVPGALDAMQTDVCLDFRACHLVPGAGHWVQQEQATEVNRHLLDFLKTLA